MIRKQILSLALAGALIFAVPAHGQNQGTSPLSIAKGGTAATTAGAARTSLGLVIGTNVQAFDADLSAIAGLTSAADKCFYFTGSATAATFDCLTWARAFISAATVGAGRTSLGVAIGTDVQAFDADLSALAGLTSANNKCFYWTGTATAANYDCTAFGRSVANTADAAALRTLGDLAALSVEDQTLAGGANVTSKSLSTGGITVDCGARPLQFITNNGAWQITAPAADGSCAILVTNGASAATATYSGFTVGSNVGDAINNTNGNKFILQVMRINGVSTYSWKALQ